MKYRREIDGLRAVAVLPVILFHAGFSLFSGGYVGVDVFFVISGYLITTIIVSEVDEGCFSFSSFYERRARRILPALIFVLLCCTPVAWMWMTPSQFQNFSTALLAVGLFSSNILFWQQEDYFAPSSENNPLLHTWSLAVEEQFYIFFPIFILLLWRFGKRPVFYMVLGLSVFSLILSELGWRHSPSANFYLLPTRAWELGVGSICALFSYKRPGRSVPFLSSLGLAMILVSIFLYDDEIPFPSLYTLVPVLGAALVILFSSPESYSTKLLSSKILVGIGVLSYSAYLWHQPLMAFFRIRSFEAPSEFSMLVISALSILLAYLTWKFVESPFRKKGGVSKKTGYVRVLRRAALSSLLLISFGSYGYFMEGFPDRVAPSGIKFRDADVEKLTEINHGLSNDCKVVSGSEKCRTGENPSVLLWGDSYAMHLMQAIRDSESFKGMELAQFARSSCAPIFGISLFRPGKYNERWAENCISFNDSVKDWLVKNDSIKYVVMSSPMNIINDSIYEEGGAIYPRSKDLVVERINDTARFIRGLGKEPVFVSPPPRNGHDLSSCAIYNIIYDRDGGEGCAISEENYSSVHASVLEFLRRDDFDLPVVMLEDYLCNEGKCDTVLNGINVYRDSGHLSQQGSGEIGRVYDMLGDIVEVGNSYDSSTEEYAGGSLAD